MASKHAPAFEVLRVVLRFITVLTVIAVLTVIGTLAQVPQASLGIASSIASPTPPLFLPPVTYTASGLQGSPFRSAAVGDLNGDGKPDVVVANYLSRTVSVLLGNGNGTFQSAVIYELGGQAPSAIAIADMNGDGKPDLVVGTTGVIVLLGNGEGTFQAAVTYLSGQVSVVDMALADVNGDGKPDLIALTGTQAYGDGVGVLLGNGDGTFQPARMYGSGGWSLAVADVNGDGKSDVLVAHLYLPSVGVLRGNGDGTFQPEVTYGAGGIEAIAIAVADFNGDGKPDLVVTSCRNYSCSDPGPLAVLLGNGDGTFQPATLYDSGPGIAWSAAIADVNRDSIPDILTVNSLNGTVGVMLGNGGGTFAPAASYATGGIGPTCIAVADVNGDGRPDVVVRNDAPSTVGVLLNSTAAHISTTTTLTSSLNPVPANHTVVFTAAITSQNGGKVTGTVTFQHRPAAGANYFPNPTVPVVDNRASWSNSYYDPGPYTISAVYSGDLNNIGSSATLTQYVQFYASRTLVVSSGSPTSVGQPVTFTATVTSKYFKIPDGELVTFHDGATAIASVPLVGGTAKYTTSSLSAKTHVIRVHYAGDKTILPSSGAVTQIVNGYPTTTILASSLNPSIYGQKVTFTAQVITPGPVPPTGTVIFMWKYFTTTYTIGTAILNSSGVATLTKSNLNADPYPMIAVYKADANNLGSTSGVLNQVITQTTSSASITSSVNPSAEGQAVTFTAKISSPTVVPSGPVTFNAGTMALGTAQLSGGKAVFTTSTLPARSTVVKVTYNGNSNIKGGSASVTQTVQP